MTLQDAILKSIRKYFDGVNPTELRNISTKRTKFKKEYFDQLGSEYNIKPYGEKDGL